MLFPLAPIEIRVIFFGPKQPLQEGLFFVLFSPVMDFGCPVFIVKIQMLESALDHFAALEMFTETKISEYGLAGFFTRFDLIAGFLKVSFYAAAGNDVIGINNGSKKSYAMRGILENAFVGVEREAFAF